MGDSYGCAHCVVKNTENLLQEKSLLDFTVRVEDVELPCHRVILAASSHFFRALLMTDMKEAKEGCVTINGISLKTFQHILKSMYTGKITLTLDNFKDIWQAADQLQIDFIVGHCEDFATKVTTVENFESMLELAKLYNSETFWIFIGTFFLQNFDSISQSNVRPIMELGFYYLSVFIDSRNLTVRNEDRLIKLVLKWVEYVPEENNSDEDECDHVQTDTTKEVSSNFDSGTSVTADLKDQLYKNKRLRRLAPLLQCVRTCLVSTPLLKHLLKHRLIINNTEARDILIDAVLYKTTHYNHGQWPASSIHRACSDWEHCGVIYLTDLIFMISSVFTQKRYLCADCSECILDVKLVVFDSYLYATGVKDTAQENSSLCVLSGNSWKKITEVPGRQLVLVSYDQCIFILNKTATEIYQIFPKCGNRKVEKFTNLPESTQVQYAISYQRMILIFSSVTVDDEEKTAVHQLDILTKKYTALEQLNGPAKRIISLSDDKNTYVLQRNGDLWTIDLKAGKVTFQLMGKWSAPMTVHESPTYEKKLIVSFPGTLKKKFEIIYEFPPLLAGYFRQIEVWNRYRSSCSNFIPVVLPKNILIPV